MAGSGLRSRSNLKWCKGGTEPLAASEVEVLNLGSPRNRRNLSLWHSDTAVGFAYAGAGAVVADSALEVGRPDSGEKKRRLVREVLA